MLSFNHKIMGVAIAASLCIVGSALLGISDETVSYAQEEGTGTDPNPVHNSETNNLSTAGWICDDDDFNTGPYQTCDVAGAAGHCSKYTYHARKCFRPASIFDTCQDEPNTNVPVDRYWTACIGQMDSGYRCPKDPNAPAQINYGVPTSIFAMSHYCHG